MIHLGLSNADLAKYGRGVLSSHRMYCRVSLYDQNEHAIASLSVPDNLVLEGQVTIDTTQPIHRALNLSILDRKHRLYLDPDSPNPSAMFPSQMIKVVRYDWINELGEYVGCPVFFGPLTRFDRQGNTAYVEAMGKEIYNLDPALCWESITIKSGTKVTAAIKTILGRNGERKFDLPYLKNRTSRTISLTRHSEAWLVARKLAQSVHHQLFYDGRGYVKMRPWPGRPHWTFTTAEHQGQKPHVLTEPNISYEFTQLRNTVEVLGPQPTEKSGKKRIQFVAYPSHNDPMSPWKLAHNGEPRYLVETIENADIKRVAQAKAIAKDRLEELMNLSRNIAFDCLPVPHLEEGDYMALRMADDTITWRMSTFTIPLTASGVMNIGATRKNRILKRRRRTNR